MCLFWPVRFAMQFDFCRHFKWCMSEATDGNDCGSRRRSSDLHPASTAKMPDVITDYLSKGGKQCYGRLCCVALCQGVGAGAQSGTRAEPGLNVGLTLENSSMVNLIQTVDQWFPAEMSTLISKNTESCPRFPVCLCAPRLFLESPWQQMKARHQGPIQS